MKFLKRTVIICAGFIAALVMTGCNKTKYTFYTNMPSNLYAVLDDDYKLGGFIEGYTPIETMAEDVDLNGYTTQGKRYFAMLTDAELAASFIKNDENEEKFTSFGNEVYKVLDGVDKALSSTVTDSDIYNFNNAAVGERIEVSEITYEVLTLAKNIYTLTDGYYNPALYYNIQAYGFGGGDIPKSSAELPSDAEIEKYTELATHFGEITVTADEDKYFVTKPSTTVEVGGETLSMKLDLGGIGKGYAVDLVDGLFDEYGYKFGYFNFGASSILTKNNLLTGAYDLHLINPRSLVRDQFLKVTVQCEKVSTSGDNEQFYYLDGVRYCHIIDPTTGKPVKTGIMSVTVLGGSAAESDALTTAIMAMGKDKAIEFIGEKLTDRRVVFTLE